MPSVLCLDTILAGMEVSHKDKCLFAHSAITFEATLTYEDQVIVVTVEGQVLI